MSIQDDAQPILGPAGRSAVFLTLTVREGQEEGVRDALTDVSGIVRAVGFRSPDGELSCIVGIGSALWDRLYAGLGVDRPEQLHPFKEVVGATHAARATPGDLFFHIRGQRQDVCFELTHQLMVRLAGLVDIVDEVDGFRYWDSRDLLGFVDGTENPSSPALLVRAGLIADGPWTSGSYVIVQKYLHNLSGWEALTTEQQEAAVGRHKLSDIELPDDAKATNAHTVLTVIEDAEGVQHSIVRDNLPFGSVSAGTYGTYFIGYAADVSVTELMLERMFVGVPEGNHDRLLDFSTAVTGCLFFIPPASFLDDPDAYAKACQTRPGT